MHDLFVEMRLQRKRRRNRIADEVVDQRRADG
jgi:hypothetical protein